MVCPNCSDFQPAALEYLRGEQRAQVWTTMDDLTRARNAGCIHCSLAMDALLAYKLVWSGEENALSIQMQMARGKPLRVNCSSEALYLEIFRPLTAALDANEYLMDIVGSAVHVPEHSGGPDCLALARSWLAECLSAHAQCVDGAKSTLPTRVLAITKLDGKLCVRLADGLGRQESYVALSYCWGPLDASRICGTVLGNVKKHQQGIDITSLFPTLQDAVELTANLGYSTLWVDALCIIQDDHEDWEREAAKMCDVYSGATLTIVAAGSDGIAKGIYQRQAFHKCHELMYKGATILTRPQLARQHTEYSKTGRLAFRP